jgi:hypothetical protein
MASVAVAGDRRMRRTSKEVRYATRQCDTRSRCDATRQRCDTRRNDFKDMGRGESNLYSLGVATARGAFLRYTASVLREVQFHAT